MEVIRVAKLPECRNSLYGFTPKGLPYEFISAIEKVTFEIVKASTNKKQELPDFHDIPDE